MKTNILKTFIRDDNTKNPRGIAVIVRDNEDIRYGYSLLNVKLDRFDKALGTTIAVNRANAESYELPSTLERETMVLDAFERLEKRAIRYFKDLDPEKIKLVPAEGGSKFTIQ